MKSVFRDILLEREFASPAPYFRRATAPPPPLLRKALAIIGVRRCGKTTYLRQLWDDLSRSRKVSPRLLLHVNFFDERLFGVAARELGQLLDAYYELHPGTGDRREALYFFLDEPQVVRGWEYFVDRLLRAGHHVFLSGSSATLLSREIASSMRGRSLSLELFPFSFGEVLSSEGRPVSGLGPRERAAARVRLREYLHQGGFPETLGAAPAMRRRLLQDYLDAVLLRDVIERHNPSDPSAVAALMHLLMNQVGSFYTLNKSCERLKAQGLKVNKPEIARGIDWFHDSYLFFSVPILSSSAQKRLVNPRKVYCIDPGMAHHHSGALSGDWGHLLENAVFLHLRRDVESIFYFKDARQREVDFAVRSPSGRLRLVQVAWSLKDPKTKDREVRALQAAMSELSLREAELVTFEEEEDIRADGSVIRVRPAWSYLLDSVPT